MSSKNRVKWRHYAISAEFIAIYGSYRSGCRDAGIVNKILFTNNIIAPDIFNVRNIMVKEISLTDDSELGGVCKSLLNRQICVLFVSVKFIVG